MKVKQAIKGVWPAVWYGLKWYFPQYTKPAEVVWKSVTTMTKASNKQRKIDRRISDLDKAIDSLADQQSQLWTERSALSNIQNYAHKVGL